MGCAWHDMMRVSISMYICTPCKAKDWRIAASPRTKIQRMCVFFCERKGGVTVGSIGLANTVGYCKEEFELERGASLMTLAYKNSDTCNRLFSYREYGHCHIHSTYVTDTYTQSPIFCFLLTGTTQVLQSTLRRYASLSALGKLRDTHKYATVSRQGCTVQKNMPENKKKKR